jgi:acyl-CoA synthetase (NDP forming)
VTHSGAFGGLIYSMAEDMGVSFRHFVSVGNEVDVGFTEVLDHMVHDDKVTGIGGYLEGIGDGRRFVEVASRAQELGKPLVLVKVGRSDRAQQAAASHTAALVGDDQLYDAVFAQTNIIRTEDVQEMLDILYLTQLGVVVDDPGVAMVSISGGLGVWAADQFSLLGLRMAELTHETRAALDQLLPSFGSSLNPVDATAQLVNDPAMLKGVLKVVLDDPNVDVLYLAMGLQESVGERLAADVVDVAAGMDKPIVVSWVCGPEALYRQFEEARVPVFEDFRRPLLALRRLSEWSGGRRRLAAEADVQSLAPTSERRHSALVEDVPALAEDQAKRLLGELGLGVPNSARIDHPTDAARLLAGLGDGPVVLKAAAPGRILHKTDLGLVRSGLRTADEVAAAHDSMTGLAREHVGADAYLFLENQSPDGVDVIVSLLSDDTFGAYVVLGLGGALVEVHASAGQHLAPLTEADALRLVRSIPKLEQLLGGIRGGAPADIEALLKAIVRVGDLAASSPQPIEMLEINPLRVLPRGQGVVVLDAVWTTGAEADR